MKKNLQDLFLDSLAELSSAESQLAKALPRMAKAATDEELREFFDRQSLEVASHVQKLEVVFVRLDAKSQARRCPAMAGLIKEAEDIMATHRRCPTINAALIYAAQKAGHYKIAACGTLREWARHLAQDDVADLMDEILEEEKCADGRLTELAGTHCNEAAVSEERRYELEYAGWAG